MFRPKTGAWNPRFLPPLADAAPLGFIWAKGRREVLHSASLGVGE